jgi:hypothetical protein
MRYTITVLLFALMFCSAAFVRDNSNPTAGNANGVLHVDGKTYKTLAQAFAACSPPGCTIDMNGNCSAPAQSLGTFDPGNLFVTIILGTCQYTATGFTLRNNFHIVGQNGSEIAQASPESPLFALPLQCSGTHKPPCLNDVVAQNVTLSHLYLTPVTGSTSDAISMVAAPSGGLWYSTFDHIVIKAGFGRNAMRFDSTALGEPPAADQFISIRDVFCYRSANGAPVLLLTGPVTGQFSIDNAEFDADGGQPGKDNYNIVISDGGIKKWMPYSIDMRNVTVQGVSGVGGAAIYVDGATGVVCEGCHFENDNGLIKEVVGTGGHGNWAIAIKDSYAATVGQNHGNGFISNTDSGSSLDFQDNAVYGTPDAWFGGSSTKFVYGIGNVNFSNGTWQPVSILPPHKILELGTQH